MASQVRAERAKRSLWGTRNGLLLAAALLSGAVAWWMIAWPVATLSNLAAHQGHFALTFAHMVGGSGMLWLGGWWLFSGRFAHVPVVAEDSVGQATAILTGDGFIVRQGARVHSNTVPKGKVVGTSPAGRW